MVHRYYVSDQSYDRDGLYCNYDVGRIISVEGEPMVKTPHGVVLSARYGWRGSMSLAATDAAVKIGKVINTLHEQIGRLLEGSEGK